MRAGVVSKAVLFVLLANLLASCQLFRTPAPAWRVDKKRYRHADPAETRVVVSVHDQTAWLLDKDGGVILKTIVSTGVTGHETPEGDHKVLERQKNKRSNKYGKYVDARTGKVVVPKTWLHHGSPPEGTVYEGIEMPYWMRLTWDGVGMHVGKFPRHTRCSFGCIRVFRDAQPLIFSKTQVGTPVSVHNESLTLEMAAKEDFSRWRWW